RGESLSIVAPNKRLCPCYIPFTQLYIDYNGLVNPCCNFRSDFEPHKKFIIGDLNKQRLLEIFNDDKVRNLRKKLLVNNIQITPCNVCNFGTECKRPW
ncbi:MAG: SPASM domain-containing protein, partial [Rickettsiales bacterium]|nr:SPASM domain-containing protein [Rickettsiales bacterium]